MARPSQRSLRTLLLLSLGVFTASAVALVGVSTVIVSGGDLSAGLTAFLLLWAWSALVGVGFGWFLIDRLVMRPVRDLAAEADTLGEPDARPITRAYDTAEFADLARRYREMAEALAEAQRRAVHVEKLASVGRLAAGVAHEVRNPLGALNTYVDVLRQRGRDDDVTDPMRGAIERIERIVQGLLAYARPGAAVGSADLNAAVESGLGFLRGHGRLAGHDVQAALTADLPPVRGSAHHLEQVVLNLVLNACQAAPGGAISVSTFETRAGASLAPQRVRQGETDRPATVQRAPLGREPRRRDVPPGTRGALLMVADQGPGVPPDDRERVFDAFFTTKSPGEGTGLGLAIVASSIEDAGGLVWVDDARGGGAAFKVFLPFAGRDDAHSDR